MQLILDKIALPAPAAVLPRPRLLGTLDESLASCTSTILNGRAGTGKTLLAAEFARRCGRCVAWYKVDAPDVDRRLFFRYLLASVRRQRAGFGSEGLADLAQTASIPEMPLLAETFVYELLESGGDPLLIVIDDLHLVYDAEWFVPVFRRLLPLLPAEAHMLVTGRSLPPAPLWRMRSKQTLCVIDEAALAFTHDEARQLFARYGLSEAQAEAAMARTRGRAATLQDTARTLSASGRAA